MFDKFFGGKSEFCFSWACQYLCTSEILFENTLTLIGLGLSANINPRPSLILKTIILGVARGVADAAKSPPEICQISKPYSNQRGQIISKL